VRVARTAAIPIKPTIATVPSCEIEETTAPKDVRVIVGLSVWVDGLKGIGTASIVPSIHSRMGEDIFAFRPRPLRRNLWHHRTLPAH
jgi:hypothetical protein